MWLRDVFQRIRGRSDSDQVEAGLTPELREAREDLERVRLRRQQIARIRADAMRAETRVKGR